VLVCRTRHPYKIGQRASRHGPRKRESHISAKKPSILRKRTLRIVQKSPRHLAKGLHVFRKQTSYRMAKTHRMPSLIFDFPQISHQSQGSFVEKHPYSMRYPIFSHTSPIQSAKPHHMLCKKALHIARYTIRKRALHSAKKALHVLHKTDTPQKNFTQSKRTIHILPRTPTYSDRWS